MKNSKPFQLLFLGVCLLLSGSGNNLLAQGTLTPPGAPAPTMKSLDQVEPRTAITNATGPVAISQPGSYYLTRNLSVTNGDAIIIATNSVTLDLNGFTISSTEAVPNGRGIFLQGATKQDITISNGHIIGGVTNNGSNVFGGPGFLHGIFYGNSPGNVHVFNISVSGVLNNGIYLGIGHITLVESCTVKTLGGVGIVADSVSRCNVGDCGGTGIIGYTVSDSRAFVTGSGTGLSATTAQNCHGTSNSGTGLSADNAQNCYAASTSAVGLNVYIANNCYGTSISGTGIDAPEGVAIGCYASSSGIGLRAKIANSCVIGNGTTNITFKYNMP